MERSSRIEIIDALRGVALFGILMVNMHYFAHPIESALLTSGANWVDRTAGFLIRLLFEGKFFPLFSFLFGLGIAVQQRRAEERGVSIRPRLYRRYAILLLLGIAHATLLWTGDILTLYALLGLVLLTFFYRTASRTNIIWAVALVVVLNLFIALGVVGIQASLADPSMAEEMRASFEQDAAASAARVVEDYEVYAEGGWVEITIERTQDFFTYSLPFLLFSAPVVFAMFLLGLSFGQYGVFSDLERYRSLFSKLAFVGLPIGLALNVVYALLADELAMSDPLTWRTSLAFFANTAGGPLLTLGYISGLTLLYHKSETAKRFLDGFVPAGRMALTNYLMHSVVWTTVFYGYGAGLLGRVGVALGVALTIVTIAIQLPFSRWWLSRFRYGPVEWLWRRLTYGRLTGGNTSPVSQ
jgi:uncharacterized protein